MIKTQIQLPDDLYEAAKRVAREREMSLAEVVRRGVEYITRVYRPVSGKAQDWSLPEPTDLGQCQAPLDQWRLLANDPASQTE